MKIEKAAISEAGWSGEQRPEVGARPMTGSCTGDVASTIRADEGSDAGEFDPELAKLIELFTRRIQAGEQVDVDELARQHSAWAREIQLLLPALRGLAELGQVAEAEGTAPASQDCAQGPRVFGDFRILREVGRGGMGIVYEAEQITLSRRVALKVLPLAVAMDPRALQRFQLEAQVAGWLQHPRIVPVYAVGLVGDVPYYAMQFVEGGSVAEVIAELRGLVGAGSGRETPGSSGTNHGELAAGLLSGRFAPSRRESSDISRGQGGALTLPEASTAPPCPSIQTRAFVRTVARLGIQAAEALGYAHDQGIIHRDIKPANLLVDRRGDLWVADFGMADVQGDAGLTLTGDLPGTLRYMSPEQALGRRALIDRRTDLYSLGATLYELLTLQSAVAGGDRSEIFRRIAEEEPTPIRRLNPAVPVDLATIVGKALSKDPSGRYETAWQLADDLGRFLDGRPISARPVGPLARTWRLCRRKPWQAGLAASLGLALVLGFAGIAWNWREAVRQKKDARTQAAKADAINRFLIDRLLGQAAPEHSAAASHVTLLEVLDRAAAEVGSSFADQPEVEASIRLAIGRTYHGLGQYAKSEAHHHAAYDILQRRKEASNPRDRLDAMSEMGHMLCHLGRLDDAEPFLVKAVAESRRVLGPTHTISLHASEYLADLHRDKGQYAEAETLYRRYLADAQRDVKPAHDIILTALNNLGVVLLNQGKTDEAEVLYRRVVDDSRVIRGPKHPDTLAALNNLGTLLEKQGKFVEAERVFTECLGLSREVLGLKHPGTLATLYNLGYVLKDQKRFAESEAVFRENLRALHETQGAEHPSTLYATSSLGSLLRSQGRLDEAEALLRPCLEAQKRILGLKHPETLKTEKRLELVLSDRAGGSAAKTLPESDVAHR